MFDGVSGPNAAQSWSDSTFVLPATLPKHRSTWRLSLALLVLLPVLIACPTATEITTDAPEDTGIDRGQRGSSLDADDTSAQTDSDDASGDSGEDNPDSAADFGGSNPDLSGDQSDDVTTDLSSDSPDDQTSDTGDDTTDICLGRNLCDAPSRVCDADTLTTCARDDNGCLVEATTDCTELADGVCNPDAGPAACESSEDPCEDIVQCGGESRSCSGDSLIVCASDPSGCLIESTTDCSLLERGFCDESGTPACNVAPDPCAGLTLCDSELRSCEGDVLLVCEADLNDCIVETQTDCTSLDRGFCDDEDDPIDCDQTPDPCDGLTLCSPDEAGLSCSGNDLVDCTQNIGSCWVQSTTDCTDTGQICNDDATPSCVDDTPCPTAISIDCSFGSNRYDTANGSDLIDDYTCSGNAYPGPERLFAFSNGQSGSITISGAAVGSGDYDLMVLDGSGGAACGTSTPCINDSTSSGGSESVTFDYAAASVAYIAWERYNSSTTGEFDLTVSCSIFVCGDGDRQGDEACDDGDVNNGDGCSSACVIEDGWTCVGGDEGCWRGSGLCADPYQINEGIYDFDTTTSGDNHGSYPTDCGGTSAYSRDSDGDDDVFLIEVPVGSTLDVLVESNELFVDLTAAMVLDCNNTSGTCIDYGDDPQELTYTNSTAAMVPVYVIADGFSSVDYGSYEITFLLTP